MTYVDPIIRRTAAGTYQLMSLNSAFGLFRPLMKAKTDRAMRATDMIPGKNPYVGFIAVLSQKPY